MALRYYKSGSTVWNSANSWSATSSAGADNAGIPTNLDDAIFDSGSGAACAITTTAGVCKTLNCTGYTGTITMNVNLTVSGNVTLGSGMSFAGTGTFAVNAAASLTSNGLAFPSRFSCTTAITITFVDNWTFSGPLTTFNNCRLNRTSSSAGNLIITGALSNSNITGTSQFTFRGISHTSAGTFGNPIVVDAGEGTYSLSGTMTAVPSITYVSGTTNMGTSTVQLANNAILNTSSTNTTSTTSTTGINFFNLTLTPNSTLGCNITINTDITSCGTLQNASGNSSVTINGAFTVYANGNFTINTTGGGGLITGQSITANNIVMGGTGTLNVISNGLSGLLTINTTGTITITRFAGNSFTYIAGTIISTSSVFACAYSAANSGNININAPGIQWNTFSCTIAAIIVLGAVLTVTTMTLTTNTTNNIAFSGSFGFTVGSLTSIGVVSNNAGLTLGAGNTYTVTTDLSLYGPTIGTVLGLKSGTPGSVAYFRLAQGATSSVGNVQPTDIDSSDGQTIWVWRPGTISNSLNWKSLSTSNVLNNSTFLD